MTTVVICQASCQTRDLAIPPASLQDVSEQWHFSKIRDDDEAPNNSDTLEDSQLSHKGKGRASPPGGELSNHTDDPRNYGSNLSNDDPNSLDSGDDVSFNPSVKY